MTEDSMHRTLDAALARNSGPSAEDVEALALLISCTEIAQDEHGDGGTLMYEPARRLAAALLASDWLAAHTAAAEARGAERGARAVVEAFDSLFSGGPDTACRTLWRDAGGGWPDEQCVVVPMADLRATFAAAREAAARVEGGA